MQLNPTLTRLLEAYELEHLQALVNWLEPDAASMTTQTLQLPEESQALESSPPKEEPIMSTLSPLSITPSTAPNTAMALDELIEFSILNEFGTGFQDTSCFGWLRNCVLQRVTPNTAAL